MFGGDEVSSLVFDLGTFQFRLGYSGEDSPKVVLTPNIGQLNNKYYFGINQLMINKPGIEIKGIMSDNGSIKDFDLLEKCIDYLLEEDLPLNLKDHPIIFTEPTLHNKENRTKLTSFMFEKYNIPAIYISKSNVLSAFSFGRSTCLVFDSGYNNTYATPINEGYALQKCLIKNEIAGKFLDSEIETILVNNKVTLYPYYYYKKTKKDNEFQIEKLYEQKDFDKKYTQSYNNFFRNLLIKDIKESLIQLSDEAPNYDKRNQKFVFNENSTMIPQNNNYYLPDGLLLDIKDQKFTYILENLFGFTFFGKEGFQGYQQMIMDAIQNADLDIKKELYANIVLCGGNTLFDNFASRMQKELLKATKQMSKLKIFTHTSNTEKKFSSWIGGSILSSLGTFHQLWLSKSEFEEHGALLIERKCA